MHGKLNLSVQRTSGLRQQFDCYQESPLRAFFPNSPLSDSLDVVLANTSGGIVGGDQLDLSIELEGTSNVAVTSQAAEKVYRSTGSETRVNVNLKIGGGANLRWNPQETIFFDGVSFRRRTSIEVTEGGSCLAGEMLVFGRTARGERLTRGLLHDEWRVRWNNRLVWADILHLSGDLPKQLQSLAGFNGSNAMGTLIYVSKDAPQLIDAAKGLTQTEECWAGATLIGGNVIVARWLSRNALALRRDYFRFAETFFNLVAENATSRLQYLNS